MAELGCPRCKQPVPPDFLSLGLAGSCPSCRAEVMVAAFPAAFRTRTPQGAGQHILTNSESTCYYHTQKRAEFACDYCGRFLCGLCEILLGQQHFCPDCISRAESQPVHTSLEKTRKLHDEIAITLAILPLLMWPITCITAPAAIYYSIRYWKAPMSLVRRSRWRFVVAIVFASLQIAGWAAIIYGITRAITSS